MITLAEPVAFDANTSMSALSASTSGLLAYRTGAGSRRQLAWFDRSGKPLGTFGERDENGLSAPSVSSDGRRVVLYRTMQGNADIWLADAVRATRFTFDAALDRFPVWSPDGSRVVFDSNRNGKRNLYQKASSGAGGESCFSNPHRTSWRTTGHSTAGSSCITAPTRRRTATSGCCPWRAIESRGCS